MQPNMQPKKKIESYEFGRLGYNGKLFTSDLLIFPDHVYANWWRKEGHLLCKDDLSEVLREAPDILVIGTGSMGAMKVPQDLIDDLNNENIQLIIEKTPTAIQSFNATDDSKKTIGAFHLTC
jgi:hypothetical protein